MITLHAAPRAVGSGDGATPGSAADYVDDAFWDRVQATLEDSAVTVSLTGDAGDYTRGRLPLLGRGHQDRALVIDGGAEPGAVMRVEPGGESGILVRDAVNITIRGVTFSGPGEIGYVTLVQSSHRIRFEGCAWVDLPGVVYGASGVHRAGSRDVLYSECVFRRVGTRPSAHMIYNANHSRQIRLVGCTFEDCSGDYVRFRNGIDECMVVGCVFASGGDYPPSAPVSRPFVAVPTFNDVDPGDETFGTHFVLARNRFTYAGAATEGHRRVLSFHHSGFDPPGRHHLMTAAEGHTSSTAPSPSVAGCSTATAGSIPSA